MKRSGTVSTIEFEQYQQLSGNRVITDTPEC